jgi:hypothetical protein
VLRIVASHDCGTPINPMLVEGQVEGGISMGVGFALEEEMLFDGAGRLVNPNLTNYIMPTSLDMPKVEVDIVDSYDPTGPVRRQGRRRADLRRHGGGHPERHSRRGGRPDSLAARHRGEGAGCNQSAAGLGARLPASDLKGLLRFPRAFAHARATRGPHP